MLEWLKGILGDAYTEEIDKAVAAEIGKAFVAKADFDAKNTELKAARAQLADAGATIEGLRAEGKDLETLRKEAEEYKARAAKAEQDAAAQLEDYKFGSWFDGLVAKHKGRDAAVIRALAGKERLAALRESKNREEDGKALFEELQKTSSYAFDTTPPPPLYAAGTGTAPLYKQDADGVTSAFAAINPGLKL